MTDHQIKSLVVNPRRVAVPALRGYSYQIWRSIHRWVTLKGNETIFLEGAEDIDVLGPSDAETIQVKNSKGPVSLSSRDVLEAITHYWEHQQRSEGLILFRFLTTAGRGRERGNIFEGKRGLDYWDHAKRPGIEVSPIRSFLQSKKSLPADLKEFLRDSSNEELRELLIKRIEWDTDNKPQPFIEQLVDKEVILYGNRVYDLPPSESSKVVPHLLRRAWETACRKADRRLDYPDFMQLFDGVVAERVSRHELQHLRRVAIGMHKQDSPHAGMSTLALDTPLDLDPLPPNERFAQRQNLVTSLSTLINDAGLLILKGSTGTGKSTLASLITAADSATWRRINFRGLEPEQIRDRLVYLSQFNANETATDYVVDDLNFDKKVSLYEDLLAELIYKLTSQGGRLIITTQGDMPTRVILQLYIPDSCIFNVPALTRQEVEQLVLNYGCDDEKLRAQWARIIFLTSSGHPQLVHARIKKLEAEGWPAALPKDFIKKEDIEQVQREARTRLREQLPSDDARTLAFYLSIIKQPFKREQVLFIGTHLGQMNTPGEGFDLLIGPWVERLNEKYYQLSPLLDGAASEVFSKQVVTELHKTVAESYLIEKSIGLVARSFMV